MAQIIDLTGQRFGRWTVESFYGIKQRNAYWLCKCDCGNEKIVAAHSLKIGNSKSCGCYKDEYVDQMRIEKVIHNEYYIDSQKIVHVTLRKGEEMLCDIDDWEKLKQYTWFKNAQGYASGNIDRKKKRFHVMILGHKQGYVIDHINRNKLDNRKENLRFLTKSGNGMNTKISKNNTSGVTGVSYKKAENKWCAQIMINRKHINLGSYKTFNEAVKARKDAEQIYFEPVLNSALKCLQEA